jgi:hypothetical protein
MLKIKTREGVFVRITVQHGSCFSTMVDDVSSPGLCMKFAKLGQVFVP